MFKPIGRKVYGPRAFALAGIVVVALAGTPVAPATAPATPSVTVTGPAASDLAGGENAWDCTASGCEYVGGWN